jgi:hypothetical protein
VSRGSLDDQAKHLVLVCMTPDQLDQYQAWLVTIHHVAYPMPIEAGGDMPVYVVVPDDEDPGQGHVDGDVLRSCDTANNMVLTRAFVPHHPPREQAA